MKSAVLVFLLAPSTAFTLTVARFSGIPSSIVAPFQLQARDVSRAPSLQAPTTLALLPQGPTLLVPAITWEPTLAVARPLVSAMPDVSVRGASSVQVLKTFLDPNIDAGGRFDGDANKRNGIPVVSPLFGGYRQLSASERIKVEATLRFGADKSPVFRALNAEFVRKGGSYLLDSNPKARYAAAASVDSHFRPVITLTYDLLNRYQGRNDDMYRGAPWEFIASVIAREQIFFNDWYAPIPFSAEKLAVSFMNMTRVFVDLTDGTSKSWATDKDYQATAGDNTTYTQWSWFEQLRAAGRDAARGAGTNTGHLIDSKFFSWVRDWIAPQDKSAIPAFQFSLWEQLKGLYYRPGNSKNGQPLPMDAPRIDRKTYDGAAEVAYGSDGKGNNPNGALDTSTAYGWIIQWLKDRREI
ncbi:MAG: hypothetical protein AAB268_03465 [Elusimicrobiota bacterium]